MDVGISSSCAGNRFLRFGRNILGDVVPRWSPLPSLFSYQNGTGDYGVPVLPFSDAVHCNRPRSALQPLLQCTASVLAVHCILHANTCNLSRKYVHPSLQVRATAPARTCVRQGKYMRPPGITFATAKYNVCNRGCKRYKPLPQTFAGKPLWRREKTSKKDV